MAVREGRWDCQYCGTKGVFGRHKSCPVCATSRPAGTKFYLPADAETVTDEDRLGYALMGPDWICAFCGSSNRASHKVCQSCFAEKKEDTVKQEVKEYIDAPTSGDMTFEPGESPKAVSSSLSQEAPGRLPRWITVGGALTIILVLGICGFIASSFFINSTVDVEVQSYEWERTVEVEAYRTIDESDWEIPAGGRVTGQAEEIHHYDQVLTGYEQKSRQVAEEVYVGEETYVCGQRDLGNGFFEDITCSDSIYETQYRTEFYDEPQYEEVPVYQMKYSYEIDKWVYDRTATASGQTHTAEWPVLILENNEREGAKTESYGILFNAADGETYRLEFSYSEWLEYSEGQTYKLEVNGFGEPGEISP